MSADAVHARGFPEWGPPTLCGAAGPVHAITGEVGCPNCLEIGADPQKLLKRIADLEQEIGKPKPATRSHVLRLVRGGLG